ncbi:MAG: hypothetical protein H6677_21630 [Candidatus Obscuribacterales bacterium]|nr:hypothetical protein [Candidatus Obscuribacterales bacterium]
MKASIRRLAMIQGLFMLLLLAVVSISVGIYFHCPDWTKFKTFTEFLLSADCYMLLLSYDLYCFALAICLVVVYLFGKLWKQTKTYEIFISISLCMALMGLLTCKL